MAEIYKLITILGPTATGKTTFAAHFAKEIGAEIISADSRQVYRGMDLGTGKDLDDYVVDDIQIPYHLIDIVDPGYEYNVYEFQRDFLNAYRKINKRDIPVIMCGGTGMYLDSVLKGYNMVEVPENTLLRDELHHKDDTELIHIFKNYRDVHNISDTSDRSRLVRAIEIQEFVKTIPEKDKFPVIESLNFGISFEREAIRKRITSRLEVRLKEGMIKEIESLLSKGIKPESLMFYGLEYKLVTQFVIGDLSFDEMFQKLKIAIHQFAKRQMTWFRRMEKQGIKINWIDGNIDLKDKVQEALHLIKNPTN
jgi:tRNA dimethylallyltransferase